MSIRIPLFFAGLMVSTPAAAGPEKVVAKTYAKLMQCPRKEIVVTPMPGTSARTGSVTHQDYQVSACGKDFIVNGGTFMGYLYYYDDQSVRKRAGLEMGCDQVTVHHIDPTVRMVDGCGKRVTYTFVGDVLLKGSWTPTAVLDLK